MSVVDRSGILHRRPRGRRISDRIGMLRAMAIEPIGDIGDVSLSDGGVTETLTWETATDWDNAVSESGVLHESVGDITDATKIQLGHATTLSGLSLYLPFDEGSGTTAADAINANDFTISGPTVGVSGLFGTTAFDFDGSNDIVYLNSEVPELTVGSSGSYSFVAWINTTSSSQTWFHTSRSSEGSLSFLHHSRSSAGEAGFFSRDDSASPTTDMGSGVTINDGNWHLVVGVYDDTNTEARVYVDGSPADNSTAQDSNTFSWDNHSIGDDIQPNAPLHPAAGTIDAPLRFNKALTDSEVDDLYNAGTGGNLTTATKSFSSATKPNLQNLDYTLNSQSITIDVIGSPGLAGEEIVSQSLDGSTSFNLTWSNSHTDFRVRPKPSTTDPTTTPTINVIELVSS